MSERPYEYNGILEAYTEQGYEGHMVVMLIDDRGMTPNPQYDPTRNEFPYNIEKWRSLSYAHDLRSGDIIEVYSKDGKTVEFQGVINKDREKMRKANLQLSMIPGEVEYNTWLTWLREERRAKVLTTAAPPIERYPDVFTENIFAPDSGSDNSGSNAGG